MRDEHHAGVQKIGIMGGTFDPIHYGHLYIAERCRYQFGFDKVLFIPSGRPVHKNTDRVTPASHRVEMVKRAIDSNPYFELSTLETERPGNSYSVDTLEQLHELYGKAVDFYFITGADTILDILTWKDVQRVFELTYFIGVTRPGFYLEEIEKVLARLSQAQRKKIIFLETVGIRISSTEIRKLLAEKQSIKYLMPEETKKYIIEHGLYS